MVPVTRAGQFQASRGDFRHCLAEISPLHAEKRSISTVTHYMPLETSRWRRHSITLIESRAVLRTSFVFSNALFTFSRVCLHVLLPRNIILENETRQFQGGQMPCALHARGINDSRHTWEGSEA